MADPPKRGEVWMARLERAQDALEHIQANTRPALVLSTDEYNQGRSNRVVIVPITSQIRNWPFRVRVTPRAGIAGLDGEILCDQLRAFPQSALTERLGMIRDRTLIQLVERQVRAILGI